MKRGPPTAMRSNLQSVMTDGVWHETMGIDYPISGSLRLLPGGTKADRT